MTDATPANEPEAETVVLDFDADTAVSCIDEHLFRSRLLDRWNIVAGPNGGYIIRHGDRVICSSLAAFSVPWTCTEEWRLPLSAYANDEAIEMARKAPPVAQNWNGRPIIDAPFFSGQGSARVAQWIRAAKPRPLDAIELVAISDAIPPAGFPKMTTPGAMPTVDLTVHIRASLPLIDPPDDDRVYAECNTHHVADGFADEDCHIWGADGRLLAQSRQLAITR